MNINGANVTLGSTLHLTAVNNGTLTIATVNGTAIVEAFGTTRNVGPGAQVSLPLGGLQVIGQPSEPQPYDLNIISRAPFNLLELPVQIPAPIAPPATADLPGLPVTSTLPPVTIPLPPTGDPNSLHPTHRLDEHLRHRIGRHPVLHCQSIWPVVGRATIRQLYRRCQCDRRRANAPCPCTPADSHSHRDPNRHTDPKHSHADGGQFPSG